MTRDFTVADSVVVAADANILYDAISDPVQMGNWSPENRGAVVEIGRASCRERV